MPNDVFTIAAVEPTQWRRGARPTTTLVLSDGRRFTLGRAPRRELSAAYGSDPHRWRGRPVTVFVEARTNSLGRRAGTLCIRPCSMPQYPLPVRGAIVLRARSARVGGDKVPEGTRLDRRPGLCMWRPITPRGIAR